MKSQITLVVALACLLGLPPALIAQSVGQKRVPAPLTASPLPTGSDTTRQRNQQPQSPRPTAEKTDDEVVEINTNLVQIDVSVTDKDGRQVTDLQPEDFEVYQNKDLQRITNFSYVAIAPSTSEVAAAIKKGVRETSPPPARLRPEQVRRTMAIVVDDLTMSFFSYGSVKDALKKFIQEQLQPGDVVSIVRTGIGTGAFQQFTSDKRQLLAIVNRMRWSPRYGNSGAAAFEAARNDTKFSGMTGFGAFENEATRQARLATEDYRAETIATGSLGTINYVVRGLRDMPGRKSVVLFSDGLPLRGSDSRVADTLRRVTDQANRAAVTLYTVDARGLIIPEMLTAQDDVAPGDTTRVREARSTAIFESQNGLNYLADQTGGRFTRGLNDLGKGLRRAFDDQQGYYLVGYRPDDSTFDARTGKLKFNSLDVRVRRPGLRVRTRKGFLGITDELTRPVANTREAQLIRAMTSPFASSEMDVRLTSFFVNDKEQGSFVRSLLHLDARDLTFKDVNGWQEATVDFIAVTFDADGRVLDQVNRTQRIRTLGQTYQAMLRNGLVHQMLLPVKRAGAYYLRVGVRDAASSRTGSAYQFIEVPNLKNDRLTLSGIIVNGNSDADRATISDASIKAGERETKGDEAAAQGSPAVRRLQPGMNLDYSYVIYNAKLDAATRQPRLTTQMRLFRDGRQVFATEPQAYNLDAQPDSRRLLAGGRLELGAGFPVGEYTLQAVVTDSLAKKDHATTTQWIDFEVVK